MVFERQKVLPSTELNVVQFIYILPFRREFHLEGLKDVSSHP